MTEIRRPFNSQTMQQAAAAFKRLDKNGDGKVLMGRYDNPQLTQGSLYISASETGFYISNNEGDKPGNTYDFNLNADGSIRPTVYKWTNTPTTNSLGLPTTKMTSDPEAPVDDNVVRLAQQAIQALLDPNIVTNAEE